MRRGVKRRLSDVQVALMVVIVVAVGTYLAFAGEIPFRHHYTLTWIVPSANNIKPKSPVRIAGVTIGTVESVGHVQDGAQAARLTLRIKKSGLPIHDDAFIKIRPRIFLEGNFFVDLQPGSPSAPIAKDGHVFPINQAAAPVQLDQLLTSLQSGTRQNLRGVLTVLDQSFQGKGAAGFNGSLKYGVGAFRDSAIVNDATLGTQEHDLSNYLKGAGAAAGGLDREPAKLQALLTELNQTFGAFASQQNALRQTFVSLPRTLTVALPALSAVNRALPPVRGLAKDLVPAAKSSLPTINATLPFVEQLRGLVSKPEARGLTADLTSVVPSLTQVNAKLPALLSEGRFNASCLNHTILPWSTDTIQDKTFPATGPVYQDSVKVLPGLAGESRSGDANGQYFNVLVSGGNFAYSTGNNDVLLTGQPLVGANPPKATRSPFRENVPCETQDPPDLRTIPTDMTKLGHRAVVPADRQAAYLKYQTKAVDWLRKQVKIGGMAGKLKVSADAATDAFIKSAPKADKQP